MPTPYIKKLANKHHTTVGKSEGKWEQAKQSAKKQGQSGNYAYITSIYKKMMHESDFTGSFKDFLQLTERHLDDESYDRGERGDRFEFDSNEEFGDNQDNPFNDSDEGEFDNWEEGDSESPTDFDDDRFDDENFDNDHDDHRLSDILNPDELEDRENGEYSDDFDIEGHPRDDEDFDDEHTDINDADELDIELDHEGDNDREGSIDDELELDFDTRRESIEYTHSFSMLSELMQLTEKKKPLKKAAKAVYHRDYQRTKNKPYRKYHPESEYVGKD